MSARESSSRAFREAPHSTSDTLMWVDVRAGEAGSCRQPRRDLLFTGKASLELRLEYLRPAPHAAGEVVGSSRFGKRDRMQDVSRTTGWEVLYGSTSTISIRNCALLKARARLEAERLLGKGQPEAPMLRSFTDSLLHPFSVIFPKFPKTIVHWAPASTPECSMCSILQCWFCTGSTGGRCWQAMAGSLVEHTLKSHLGPRFMSHRSSRGM